ncbi:hypothetical protein PIB19_04525 [Sphingomonas sp. 7/4-4]|nr:hypothetical protein [Sphingomonas sp. 7/4-4]WBY08714.1 hypothetical protein PIB19_04525 [Sphingomonas sp. 7/4-4]
MHPGITAPSIRLTVRTQPASATIATRSIWRIMRKTRVRCFNSSAIAESEMEGEPRTSARTSSCGMSSRSAAMRSSAAKTSAAAKCPSATTSIARGRGGYG